MTKVDCDRIEKERNQLRDEAEELRSNLERITKLKVRGHVTSLRLMRLFHAPNIQVLIS